VTRPRAADDFATIRARIEELRRERAQAPKTETRETEGRSLETRGLLRRLEGRQRPEPEDPPAASSSRRYGSGAKPADARRSNAERKTATNVGGDRASVDALPQEIWCRCKCIGMTTSGSSRSSSVTV